jgi:hypothetical protein
MSKKSVRWLYGELPKLVEQGVLTPDVEAKVRSHYGPLERERPARLAVIIFSVLGSLLIGGGIILMLAHNWETLSRPARAALSFLPLLLAQAIGGWTLLQRPHSTAWREGSGTAIFLMIGAGISLVAQTYNISGDLPRFILTWSLLGLPLLYLFDAVVPAILYTWGITEWACHLRCEESFSGAYWILVLALIPKLASWLRDSRSVVRPALLMWALCVSVSVAAGVTMERVLPGLWIIVYSAMYALMFLAGEFWFYDSDGFWSRPLRNFGAGGILVLSFILTFTWPWDEIGWRHWDFEHVYGAPWRVIPDVVLGAAIPVSALVLLVTTVRRRTTTGLVLGALPVVAIVGYCLAALMETYAAAVLFNLYVLAAGVWLMVSGIKNAMQGLMNIGLATVAALITARFFDSEMSFFVRGLTFIALGSAFLVANVLMLRRKGARREQT